MADFLITAPDGKKYRVSGDNAEGAYAALTMMLEGKQPDPEPQTERPQSQILMDQYEAAERAGNYDEADRLLKEASYAATQDGSAPESVAYNPGTGRMEDMALRPDAGRLNAAAQGLGQGVSLGAMDETVGALHGLIGPGTYAQNRDYALKSMRADLASARENYPVTTIGAEIAGGVATGLGATSALPAARTVTGVAAQNIGVGAGLGGLQGFAAGEGRALNRFGSAKNGAFIGAATGAAAQPVAWGLRTGWNALANAGRRVMPSASSVSVQNALADAVRGSGKGNLGAMNELALARADGHSGFTLADALGISGQRALSGAVRQGGEAKRVAAEFLDARQAGQGNRLSEALVDNLGTRPNPPGTALVPWTEQSAAEIAEGTKRAAAAAEGRKVMKTAEATRADMTAARSKAADKAYEEARNGAGAVDVRSAVAAIDDRIGPMQGSGIRGDGIDAKLAGYRARLAAEPPGPKFAGADSVELSDFSRVLGVKQAIQDDIGAAVRAGRNNEARELGQIVTRLDEALENASAGYRAANDGFRKASREIDQIDAGARAFAPSQRAEDTVSSYRGLSSQPERDAFRVGYGDKLLGRIESSAEGVNKARALTSEKSGMELGAMAHTPDRLSRTIGRENTMFQTRAAALGGSQTADNMFDAAGTNALARIPTTFSGMLDAGFSAVNSLARGQNSATREALVRQLLSTGEDAAKALAVAVARGERLSAQQINLMRSILVGGGQIGNQLPK